MAAWRRDQNPSLETQAWKTLHIDGHSFLVKGLFTSNSYDILITDFGVIWEESMKEQDISQRSKVIYHCLHKVQKCVITYHI